MKNIILTFLLFSIGAYSYSLKITGNIPTEAKFIFHCLERSISKNNIENTINDFTDALKYVEKKEAYFIIKSEIYKFLLSQPSPQSQPLSKLKNSLEELSKNRSHYCMFSQWIIYAMNTDLKKYAQKQKNDPYRKKSFDYISHWSSEILNSKKDKEKNISYQYHSLIKAISNKLLYFRKEGRDSGLTVEIKVLPNQETKGKQKHSDSKEELDKLFQQVK